MSEENIIYPYLGWLVLNHWWFVLNEFCKRRGEDQYNGL